MTTFADILKRQRELFLKFEDIEHTNGLLLDWRDELDDLDSPLQQMKVRRYLWAITEEIGETLESRWLGSTSTEEIADAFHYVMELYIILRMLPYSLTLEMTFAIEEEHPIVKVKTIDEYWLVCLVQLARLGNLFKNRPHTQRRRPTSRVSVESALHQVLQTFIRACISERVTPEVLAASYFEKADVNDHRIKSGL